MSESEEHKFMFVELISSSPTPASTHSFIARLTNPIVMLVNSRDRIQNNRTDGFQNIFRKNLESEIVKSLNDDIERFTVVLPWDN